MITQHTYHAEQPGPHMVILGAVHGNEQCGSAALQRLQQALTQGELRLQRGRLSLIPIANPQGYAKNVRFLERNLNRSLYPKANPVSYEDHLDMALCSLLNEADVLVDLHSYQSPGGPFAFLSEGQPEERALALALGVPYFVYGWAEAFGDCHDNPFTAMGTTEYVRYQGDFSSAPGALAGWHKDKAGIGVTVECGHHHNPDNIEVAYKVSLYALNSLQMVTPEQRPLVVDPPVCIRMQKVFLKTKSGRLVKPWQHTDAVTAGEVIAEYDDGELLRAPENGYVVLPKTTLDHGKNAEWFYFGVQDNRILE